jgi:ribose transport system substrate-binding protein
MREISGIQHREVFRMKIHSKSLSRIVGLLAGTASLSLVLAGCSAAGGGSETTKAPVVSKVSYTAGIPLSATGAGACVANGKSDAKQSIAYVPPTTAFNYYLAIGKGIEARAAGAGAKYFMLAPAKDDVSVQLGMLQDAATRGVDAIIMNTHDQSAAAPVVKAAAAKGIAIILVNSDIPDFPTPVQAVVGYKQRVGDQKVGDYAVKAAGSTAVKYGVIEGAPGYFSDERVGGWEQGVRSASNFTKVASVNGEWSVDGGNKAALDLVQAHPEITTIFAANDYMAQGAAQALKALSRTDIVVYGSDGDTNSGLEEVAAGAIKATLNTSPYEMGQIAMQVALDCLSGAFAGGEFVESPGIVVDKTQVNSILCKPDQLYPAPNKAYACS